MYSTSIRLCDCDRDHVTTVPLYIKHILKGECSHWLMRCPFTEKYHELQSGPPCDGVLINHSDIGTSLYRHLKRYCAAMITCTECKDCVPLSEVFFFIIYFIFYIFSLPTLH